MEEEVDSDREEEEEGPGDMLQAWLGELDTLKKVSIAISRNRGRVEHCHQEEHGEK